MFPHISPKTTIIKITKQRYTIVIKIDINSTKKERNAFWSFKLAISDWFSSFVFISSFSFIYNAWKWEQKVHICLLIPYPFYTWWLFKTRKKNKEKKTVRSKWLLCEIRYIQKKQKNHSKRSVRTKIRISQAMAEGAYNECYIEFILLLKANLTAKRNKIESEKVKISLEQNKTNR